MSLFTDIFRPDRKQKNAVYGAEVFKTLTPYKPVFHTWQGSIYESELIRAAISARARHISKLKFDSTGSAKIGLQSKLKQGPNQWQTWPQFLSRTSTILDIHNTAFIVPVKDKSLTTTGYYTVLPTRCEVVEYADEVWLRYRFNTGEIGAVRLDECVILTQHQYKKDFFGESNTALDSTLKVIDINKQGVEEAIRNGATFRFWAKMNNFTKNDDLKREADRFGELAFGGDSDGMLLFPNTYTDIHQYENKPYTVDPAQLEQIQHNVYQYFGVNQKILENEAYGDSWAAFYEGCVEVFAIALSDGMTKAMFTERERATGNHVIFTSNRLQYMSNADKLAVASQLTDRGIFSINEAREVFNLPPIENGDIRTIRGEYKNVSDLEETPNEE
ncbi:MAG: phage portal protein [Clostridiales bacterium]|nr:phage portal protein [Clostridiales bacterium]